MLDKIIEYIAGDPVLLFMPMLILVNLISGVIAAIKTKTFQAKKLPNFMYIGVLIMVFLIIINILNQATTESEFGAFAVTGVQGIKGAAWLGAVIYYIASIVKNFKTLGMPVSKDLDEKLDNLTEGTGNSVTNPPDTANQDGDTTNNEGENL
jgi:phage-related holin